MPWLMRFVLYSLMFMGTFWLVRRLRGRMASSFNGPYAQSPDEGGKRRKRQDRAPGPVGNSTPGTGRLA